MEGTVFVDEMLDAMPVELFDRWQAFDELEPIGPHSIVDVMALHAATQTFTPEGESDVTPEHFKPWISAEERQRMHAPQVAGPKQIRRMFPGAFRRSE